MRLGLAWVSLTIVLGGCASMDNGLMPPTVTLPLHHSGINDVRHKFHKVLADQLRSEQAADSLLHMDGVLCSGSASKCEIPKTVSARAQSAAMAGTCQ